MQVWKTVYIEEKMLGWESFSSPCSSPVSAFTNCVSWVIQFNSSKLFSVPALLDTKGIKTMSNYHQKGLIIK